MYARALCAVASLLPTLALASEPATSEGPGAAPQAPPPAAEEDRPVTAMGILGFELLFAGYSAWAAFQPKAAGWTYVVLSPLACSGGKAGEEALCVAGIAGFAGIGLANALWLADDRYSPLERFGINLAAWQVVALAWHALDPSRRAAEEATGPKVGAGIGPGGAPMLVVSARF